MRSIRIILIMTMALAASVSAQTKYFGGIDVGSKGTKAALFSSTLKAGESQIDLIFGRTINGRLVSLMKDRRFTAVGIHETVDATKQLLDNLRAEAAKRKLNDVEYYVVGSSGVALGENKDELAAAIKEATQIDMDFIDAKREGLFGLTSTVPPARRRTSMYIDVGSGNTKLGCLVDGSDPRSFRSDEIKYGSVSGRNEGAKLNPTDIPAGIQQLMQENVGPAYSRERMDIPCLSNRQRIYWTGGAAWATATLTHPEKVLDPYVVISKRDIEAFLSRLRDRSWNQGQLNFVFPQNTAQAVQNRIRSRAEKERDDVLNTFVREDLLSGVSIMMTVLENSNPSAVLLFGRQSGYIYGYALEKYQQVDRPGVGRGDVLPGEQHTRGPSATRSSRPARWKEETPPMACPTTSWSTSRACRSINIAISSGYL